MRKRAALQQARTALRESEHRLRAVVGAAPIVLWAIDQEGTFTLSDGRGLSSLGLRPGEAVGESVWELYKDQPQVAAEVRRALAGEEFTAEIDLGGTVFETRYTPIFDERGRQTGVIGVSTEVTDRVRAVRDLRVAREETIRRLARAVEIRSAETGGHIDRVSHYCALLARNLGLEADRCELIRVASPMHDVGKLAVPDEVLLKPGPLDAGERAVMERHAEVAHHLLSGSGAELPELAAMIGWTHHERYDGSGYPRGLAADEIPLEGRITAVGDVFDALTHDRVYRRAMAIDEAVYLMSEGRGSHFDPEVLDCFFDSLDDVREIRARLAPPRA